ncbi:MAG: FAD:protein FMN transferase, partial [Clostridia bacterium]|nr:FAD:protein FMN transferase [Clostridia bacterium]
YTDPACRVDLGAIAKGYTTERAAEVLESCGLTNYLINAGGNVRCGTAGSSASGDRLWRSCAIP